MNWKPKHASDITPYLIVENVTALIRYLTEAFNAQLEGKLQRPNGTLMHAEIRIGDSLIMLGEPMGEFDAMPSNLFLYVPDAEAVMDAALKAGGTEVMPLTDMAHAGVRYGGIKDPSGNNWWVGTHLRDMTWQEQQDHIDSTAQSWLED